MIKPGNVGTVWGKPTSWFSRPEDTPVPRILPFCVGLVIMYLYPPQRSSYAQSAGSQTHLHGGENTRNRALYALTAPAISSQNVHTVTPLLAKQ